MTESLDTGSFTPILTTTDWNDEWMRLQKARRAADDASYWDARSKTFRRADSPSCYVGNFLELAGVQPGEKVLDMGCGSGALSVPLAAEGCAVIAADFSDGMLARTREECEAADVSGVETMKLSWADDWEAHGLAPKSVDVALASRSIATDDLEAALMKLTGVARRRACITLTTGASPRTNEQVLAACGLQHLLGRDHAYAFMILTHAGLTPTVDYIVSERDASYASPEEAHASLAAMVRDVCGTQVEKAAMDAALDKLEVWLGTELVANEHAGESDGRGDIQKAWRLRTPHRITWAFLAWECANA